MPGLFQRSSAAHREAGPFSEYHREAGSLTKRHGLFQIPRASQREADLSQIGRAFQRKALRVIEKQGTHMFIIKMYVNCNIFPFASKLRKSKNCWPLIILLAWEHCLRCKLLLYFLVPLGFQMVLLKTCYCPKYCNHALSLFFLLLRKSC